MAGSTETPVFNHRAPSSNPAANPPNTTLQAHTNFMEIKVHTAKCDLCEKHNTLTLYRCMQCDQHVCSSCWKKSGDRTHIFGGGSRNARESQSRNEIKNGSAEGEKGHGNKNARRTRTRKRARVISSDEDDEDSPVLTPGSVTENTEAIDASKRQRKRINVVMNADQHQDHEGEHEDHLPSLWPMLPARGLPVLRPAVPTASTSATGSANAATQENTYIHKVANDLERHRNEQLRRQRTYVSVSEHETNLPNPRPSQSFISNQHATHYAHRADLPTIYRPRPGSDLAANARNQFAIPNTQLPSGRAARPAQPSITTQQAPRQLPPSVYRPRPEADGYLQTPRSHLTFAPHQHNRNQPAPRPGQISLSHQQALRPVPRAAQPSVVISQNHVQSTTVHTDQLAARDDQGRERYLKELRQRTGPYMDAKVMDARNRQALSLQQNASQPAANRDRLATRNQQAFVSNQMSSSAARYEQMIAARDRQQYLARRQTNRQAPGAAQSSISQPRANNLSPPSRAFLSQMHAASLASRAVQADSPEAIEAADALLSYARVEPNPRHHFPAKKDGKRDSHMPSPAGGLGNPSPARSESHSSPTPLASPSGATGAQSMISPRGNTSPRGTHADSTKARLDAYQRHLAGLQSPPGTRTVVSDTPARQGSHSSHRHAAMQSGSGRTFGDPSAAKSNGSRLRSVQSHSGSMPPMSDHAAAYFDKWDAGRAALYPNPSNAAVDVPALHLESPRSTIPPVSVQDTTCGGKEPGVVRETTSPTPSTPVSAPERPNDVDIVMGSPEAGILETDQSRSSGVRTAGNDDDREVEKLPGGETQDGLETKNEHEASSSDVDLDDPRPRRDIEAETLARIDDDDDGDDDNDVEITSWDWLDGDKTTTNSNRDRRGAAKAEVKDLKLSDQVIKKGVAYVKKPELKARRGRRTLRN